MISDDQLAKLAAQWAAVEKKERAKHRSDAPPVPDKVAASEIAAAVRAIPNNDEHYDHYLRIMMAIKNALGDGGEALADEWARKSMKYNEADQKKYWNSIGAVARDGGLSVTAATIFFEAKKHGWRPTGREHKRAEPKKKSGHPHLRLVKEEAGSTEQQQSADAPDDAAAGTAPAAVEKTDIEVHAGGLTEAAEAVEHAMTARYRDIEIFQRGGILSRVHLQTPEERERSAKLGIQRSENAPVLQYVNEHLLTRCLGKYIRFQMWKKSGKELMLMTVDPPERLMKVVLANTGYWHVPPLKGVIEAPILLPDGRILDQPGYDEESGLFLKQSNIEWLPVPKRPTRVEVAAAVKVLNEPFSEFPLDDTSRAVVIAAVLTAIQRRLLHVAPLFAFDAPMPSSGKTLLASVIGAITIGRETTLTSYDKEDELEKRLISMLLEGDPIIVIDNLERWFKSAALAAMTSFNVYTGRILGTTSRPQLPTNAMFMLTGNNLTLSGDMPSRTLVARIEPECEEPGKREFKRNNLLGYVFKERAHLIAASLTILRGYHVAGRPEQKKLAPFYKFEQWNSEIRHAVVWAGLADPVASQDDVIAGDPVREDAIEVLRAWHDLFESREVTLGEVIRAAEENTIEHKISGKENAAPPPADKTKALKAALLAVAEERYSRGENRVSARRLAAWCRIHRGRIYEGLEINTPPRGAHGGVSFWFVKLHKPLRRGVLTEGSVM